MKNMPTCCLIAVFLTTALLSSVAIAQTMTLKVITSKPQVFSSFSDGCSGGSLPFISVPGGGGSSGCGGWGTVGVQEKNVDKCGVTSVPTVTIPWSPTMFGGKTTTQGICFPSATYPNLLIGMEREPSWGDIELMPVLKRSDPTKLKVKAFVQYYTNSSTHHPDVYINFRKYPTTKTSDYPKGQGPAFQVFDVDQSAVNFGTGKSQYNPQDPQNPLWYVDPGINSVSIDGKGSWTNISRVFISVDAPAIVIAVHGMNSSASVWSQNNYPSSLRTGGPMYAPQLFSVLTPVSMRDGIIPRAQPLAKYLLNIVRSSGWSRFAFICHSAGCLVTQELLGGNYEVNNYIDPVVLPFIAAPLGGPALADMAVQRFKNKATFDSSLDYTSDWIAYLMSKVLYDGQPGLLNDMTTPVRRQVNERLNVRMPRYRWGFPLVNGVVQTGLPVLTDRMHWIADANRQESELNITAQKALGFTGLAVDPALAGKLQETYKFTGANTQFQTTVITRCNNRTYRGENIGWCQEVNVLKPVPTTHIEYNDFLVSKTVATGTEYWRSNFKLVNAHHVDIVGVVRDQVMALLEQADQKFVYWPVTI